LLYVVLASDLKAKSLLNLILKYADDTNLIVPQHTDTTIEEEFEAIISWTQSNKMQLNVKKTKELVFHRPHPRQPLPDPLPQIDRVKELKLLGVVVNATFKFDEHVLKMLSLCNQRLYLLKQLKSQGLDRSQLNIVYTALIVSRILYALPAWGGFLSSELLNKIDKLLRKAFKFGYTTEIVNVRDLLQNADNKLFTLMFQPCHCLHSLLPDVKNTDVVLRNSNRFNLPQCNYNLYKQSFVTRCLFRDSY
jgi:hypothetical protein